jgi:hypothetical protein
MVKKIDILTITFVLMQFHLYAQKVQEFQTDESFVKNGVIETYIFFDSTFSFSVNLKGFSSARTESRGVYHKLNDSAYILNSGSNETLVNETSKEKNKANSLNAGFPKYTYDISVRESNDKAKPFLFLSKMLS